MSARANYVVSPPIPKSEADFATIMDKWRENYNYMRKFNKHFVMPRAFIEASLRKIMVGTAKEYWEHIVDK